MNKKFRQASIGVSKEGSISDAKTLLGKYSTEVSLAGSGDQTIVRGPINVEDSTHLTNTVSLANQKASNPLYELEIQ